MPPAGWATDDERLTNSCGTFVLVSRSMPTSRHLRSRKRLLPAPFRALEMLGSCKDGCPEGILRARCFAITHGRTCARRLARRPPRAWSRARASSKSRVCGSPTSVAPVRRSGNIPRRPSWPDRWQNNWAAICHAAKITGARIHDLRHTHASMLVSASLFAFDCRRVFGILNRSRLRVPRMRAAIP